MFEPHETKEIEIFIARNISSARESTWKSIISDEFIITHVISKMEASNIVTLCRTLLRDAIKHKNFNTLLSNKLFDDKLLVNAVLYICLSKILETVDLESQESIVSLISADVFVTETVHDEQVEKLWEVLKRKINICSKKRIHYADDGTLSTYLDILQKIPITYTSRNAQAVSLLCLLHVLISVRSSLSLVIRNQVEQLITGKMVLLKHFGLNKCSCQVRVTYQVIQF